MYLFSLYIYKYFSRRIPVRLREMLQKRNITQWENSNKRISPPHVVKQRVIQQYQKQYHCQTFVETGTYLGDMVFAVRNIFKTIYSIEISETLYRYALLTFNTFHYITIIQGDSGIILKRLIPQLKTKTLFWLDGHYSGGITGKGNKNCPIIEELDAIFSSKINHVVLIDDAHCFIGTNDYPTLTYVEKFIKKKKTALYSFTRRQYYMCCGEIEIKNVW